MYVVIEAFDDDFAMVLDLNTYVKTQFNAKELVALSKSHDILGLSVSGSKINYINAYRTLSFASESEADDYIKDNSDTVSYRNKRYINGLYFVLEKTNKITHVDYYVCTYAGDEVTYVGNKGGYTPYIQAAKPMSRREAGEISAMMTRNSKTGKTWLMRRVPVSPFR